MSAYGQLRRLIAVPLVIATIVLAIPYILYAVVDRGSEVNGRAAERIELTAEAIVCSWDKVSETGDLSGDITAEVKKALSSDLLDDCAVVFVPDGVSASSVESAVDWGIADNAPPVMGELVSGHLPDGTKAFAMWSRVDGDSDGLPSGMLAVAIPSERYDAALTRYVFTDGAFLLVLLASVLAALWIPVREYVTKPIEKFDNAVSQVAEGNLGLRVNKREIGARGELASLVDSFNSMVENVERSQDEIERRVTERTAQLSRANSLLEARADQIQALNEELLEQNRYKSDFLAVMSHELKTPITSLAINVDNLRDEEDATARNDTCNQMRLSLDKLLNQVLMILDAAKVESGKMEPHLRAVDIDDVIVQASVALAPIAREQGITCTVNTGEIPVVMSDSDMVYKIGMNLVGNALKFTPSGGRVDVKVEYDNDAHKLTMFVQDTGIGFGDKDPERLFDRFHQGDSSLSRAYGGTGLGLSLSRDFARLLGGDIQAHSLEQGSLFVAEIKAEPWMEEDDGDDEDPCRR